MVKPLYIIMGFKMNRSINANELASHIDFEEFIGVFDSGMGGISTLIELVKAFPKEKFVYFGDNANAPYGTKSKEEILNLSDAIVHSFIQAGAKAVIIACNTATSASLDVLKQKYTIPIVGIEPELEQAVIENAGKNILVMGTNATLSGNLYNQKLQSFLQKKKGKKIPKRIDSIPMPKLVELVESGKNSQADVEMVLNEIDSNIVHSASCIVLGCTHFVLLKSQIFKYMNDLGVDVKLYEGNGKVIKKLSDFLNLGVNIQKNVSLDDIKKSKNILLLSSDGNKLDRMKDIFEQNFELRDFLNLKNIIKSKKITKFDMDLLLKNVNEFLEEKKLDELDIDLINTKYFKCSSLNIQNFSRKYKKTSKYVRDRIMWLDNELFKFLSKKI